MEETNKGGRPSIYTEELANRICGRLAKGESLRRICMEESMPNPDTIYQWVLENRGKDEKGENGFSDKYACAREMQAEVMFDEILEIADDGTNDLMTITKGSNTYNVEDREVTNRSRLRVDSRKWYLSKVLPKKFGEKVDITSGDKPIVGNTIILKDFNGTPTDSK